MKAERGDDIELILKTKKENNSGILSNERLLMIKAGIISYFSEAPKKFTGSSKFLQTSGQFPKYTIRANDIDHMELKGGVLSMLFKKSKLISRNEFQDMVKRREYEPDRSSEISASEEVTGFVKWNFECENQQELKEFYRYTNLFRCNNPKFVPSLSAVISSFRGEKKPPQPRQMSMKPAATQKLYQNDLEKQRLSQVVPASNGKDLFMEILDKSKLTNIEPQVLPQVQPKVQPKVQLARESQSERLNKLKSRISTMHLPMERIEQKQNEDKLSEISRHPMENKQGLKRTISEVVEEPPEPPGVEAVAAEEKEKSLIQDLMEPQVQQIQQPAQPPKVQPQPTTIQPKPEQPEKRVEAQPKQSQPKEQPNLETPPKIEQPIQASEPLREAQKEPQKETQREAQKETQREAQKETQREAQREAQRGQPVSKAKRVRIGQTGFLNSSYDLQSNYTEEESTKKRRKKLQQFLRATSYTDSFNPKQVCKKLSISQEQLQQLIKSHSKEEQQPWAFIESNLGYWLSRKEPTETMSVGDDVIREYYKLGQQSEDSSEFLKIPLEGEISYIAAESANEEEAQALEWMQQQIRSSAPKTLATRIINKTHFKVYMREVDFRRESMRQLKGGWIVNRNGHLQEFLAYLRLEKVLRELNSASHDLQLLLAETIYLRYKQFEGIGKEWRVGYPCLPIRSIKSLEYITRSREMQGFYRDYPQFNIIAEIIREGYRYRLHLDRIAEGEEPKKDQTLQELKKLIFPFDNELDLFYQNQQYALIEDHCLQQIEKVMVGKRRVEKEDLYAMMEGMEDNISVDTLCKLVGCRIDRRGEIHFYHTVLRVGGRQFGEEISLIKRWKRRGNLEMGRELSKRLLGKLHEYQSVTPISHFIEIYLHVIDFMVVNEGELHRAVPILLRVLSRLGQCEVEQYPIYLALMKTYLKLGEVQNFIKTLENCRLFVSQMFKQYSPLLDYSLQRIVTMVMLREDSQRALQYSCRLLKQIGQSPYFSEGLKEKYVSKLEWDKSNILVAMGKASQAFQDCLHKLAQIEQTTTYYPDYWVEGVLCLSKCWLALPETNSVSSAELQKRVGHAIELAFARENLEMVFVLFQAGREVVGRCEELGLPTLLSSQAAFEQAKIEFHETQSEIFLLLAQPN